MPSLILYEFAFRNLVRVSLTIPFFKACRRENAFLNHTLSCEVLNYPVRYSDQHDFSSIFKRICGLSPKEYKSQC